MASTPVRAPSGPGPGLRPGDATVAQAASQAPSGTAVRSELGRRTRPATCIAPPCNARAALACRACPGGQHHRCPHPASGCQRGYGNRLPPAGKRFPYSRDVHHRRHAAARRWVGTRAAIATDTQRAGDHAKRLLQWSRQRGSAQSVLSTCTCSGWLGCAWRCGCGSGFGWLMAIIVPAATAAAATAASAAGMRTPHRRSSE